MKTHLSAILFLLLPVVLLAQNQDPFLSGKAEMVKGNYNDAIRIFTSGLSMDKASADLLLNLGQSYYEISDYHKAIHYFILADQKKKNISSFWLAKAYALSGQYDSSIINLNAHLSSPYKVPESVIKLDPAFRDIENSLSWKDLWKQEWYDEFENLLAEISYLSNHKEYIEALDLIDQNIAKYTRRHQMYAARGKVFLALGNFNSAVTAYSQAIDISGTQCDYYIERAQAYSLLKKYDLAVSDLTRALNMQPDHFNLYIERSRLYNSLSKYEPAINDISFYLSYFPDDVEAMYECGQIYYNKGNYLKSLEWFNKCLSIDQSKTYLYNARGASYLKTRSFKFAIQDFGMALDLDPGNSEAYFNKGMARFYLNDTEGACYDWQKAARLGSKEAIEMINSHCQSQK